MHGKIPQKRCKNIVSSLWSSGTKRWTGSSHLYASLYRQYLLRALNSLVQAGLFSAILTAFNVISYQLLQLAPADETNMILARISSQLDSFAITSSFVNSTRASFDRDPPLPFNPPEYAVWLNSLWFSSLVFSLASATLMIIVKQWLKSYSIKLYGSSRDIARRRQYRLDNLERWRVSVVVALIPFLLLVAVVLFLIGLIILVHSIHRTVTIVVSVLVAVLFTFLAVTTILPTVYASCPYYSPQAYGAFLISKVITIVSCAMGIVVVTPICYLLSFLELCVKNFKAPQEERSPMPGYLFLDTLRHRLRHYMADRPVWRGGEHDGAASRPTQLDVDVMLKAYTATLDVTALEHALICIADSRDGKLGDAYIDKLENVLNARGAREKWPPLIKHHFQDLRLSAFRCSIAFPPGGDLHAKIQRRLSEEADSIPPQEHIRLLALVSMGWKSYKIVADQAWRDIWGKLVVESFRVQDLVTHRTGKCFSLCHVDNCVADTERSRGSWGG